MQSEQLLEIRSSQATASQPSGSRLGTSKPKTNATKQKRNEIQQKYNFLEEIVDVQEILYSFSNSNQVRQEFLNGLGSVPRLTLVDIENLKIFHNLTTSAKRPQKAEFNVSTLFMPDENQVEVSRHFTLLMKDSKEKVTGTNVSYAEGKAVIQRVLDSGHFSEIRRKNARLEKEKQHKKEQQILIDRLNQQKSKLSNATGNENVIVNDVSKNLLREKNDETTRDTLKV